MDLYKLIKNKVMGVLDKQKQKQAQKQINQQQLTQLNDIELKYLITLIGKSDFKGSDLQIIYSITAKLQNQLKK
jgi:hypothetical protein|tara:strand:+ start:1774 stop:1995 length:222 start_codon:yes stop_codon:yes gene_type:complete